MAESKKISTLEKAVVEKKSDLFLKIRLNYIDKAEDETNEVKPYDCTAVKLESISTSLLQRDRTVKNKWKFNKTPKEAIRLNPENFFNNYILNANNRKDVAYLNGNGSYSRNSTMFKEAIKSTMAEATNSSQLSIANIDYVNRMAALLYDYWINSLEEFTKSIFKNAVIPSAVGEIVFSTTLNNEAAVRKYYGDGQTVLFSIGNRKILAPNTRWVQHKEHYFFAAKNSGVKANKTDPNDSSGGFNKGSNNDVKVTDKKYLPSHGHDLDSHTHTGVSASGRTREYINNVFFGRSHAVSSGSAAYIDHQGGDIFAYGGQFTQGSISFSGSFGTGDGGATTTTTYGSGFTLKILQKYKNVYVWERIST